MAIEYSPSALEQAAGMLRSAAVQQANLSDDPLRRISLGVQSRIDSNIFGAAAVQGTGTYKQRPTPLRFEVVPAANGYVVSFSHEVGATAAVHVATDVPSLVELLTSLIAVAALEREG